MDDFKKKFQELFENWKFFFIEVVEAGSVSYEAIMKERTEEGMIRWVELRQDELIDEYQKYYKDIAARERESDGRESGEGHKSHK